MKYILNENWKNLIADEFSADYKQKLFGWLNNEYLTQTIYPPKDKVFAALNAVEPDDVKVVIIGQDPYHTPGQADGMAFSCAKGVLQPSLKNIFEEIKNCYNKYPKTTGSLECWAKQGVLLLNTSLTVREGQPNSHSKCGWLEFGKTIISVVNKLDRPIVFMLWGGNAKQFLPMLNNKNHLILTASHPSPLSAYNGFFGCKHFLKANEFLNNHNITEIDWLK